MGNTVSTNNKVSIYFNRYFYRLHRGLGMLWYLCRTGVDFESIFLCRERKLLADNLLVLVGIDKAEK